MYALTLTRGHAHDARNDVGLLSEDYDVRGRHLNGNFPQALSQP